LQGNLPSTSIRDLVVHGSDLVAGTHGRSFWILDDIAPLRSLRQLTVTHGAYLFPPAAAYRLRRDTWTDTPLPPEESAGKNPPDGAILDYYLANDRGPVTLAIYDSSGALARKWSSTDVPPAVDLQSLRVPAYWIRPPQILSPAAGLHRFLWDYRYPEPRADSYDYPISAIVHDTPRAPQGVLALPGTYTVTLTVGATTYRRSLQLRMDPRVQISAAALRLQFDLASRIVRLMNESYSAERAAGTRKDRTAERRFAGDNAQLAQLLDVVESADVAPTVQVTAAVAAVDRDLHSR
jgi:hypothetical protein